MKLLYACLTTNLWCWRCAWRGRHNTWHRKSFPYPHAPSPAWFKRLCMTMLFYSLDYCDYCNYSVHCDYWNALGLFRLLQTTNLNSRNNLNTSNNPNNLNNPLLSCNYFFWHHVDHSDYSVHSKNCDYCDYCKHEGLFRLLQLSNMNNRNNLNDRNNLNGLNNSRNYKLDYSDYSFHLLLFRLFWLLQILTIIGIIQIQNNNTQNHGLKKKTIVLDQQEILKTWGFLVWYPTWCPYIIFILGHRLENPRGYTHIDWFFKVHSQQI